MNIPLLAFSQPGLIALANAFGEELKRWAEDGLESTEDFGALDIQFWAICKMLEDQGVVVSDHVVLP